MYLCDYVDGVYYYYNENTDSIVTSNMLLDCNNVSNGKCLGFSLKDLRSDRDGTFKCIGLMEELDSNNKLCSIRVYILHSGVVCSIEVSDLIFRSRRAGKCVIINYSLVENKFLRKKNIQAVGKINPLRLKSIRDFKLEIRKRDFKLGAKCISTYSINNKSSITEIWYNKSCILKLVYESIDNILKDDKCDVSLYIMTDGKYNILDSTKFSCKAKSNDLGIVNCIYDLYVKEHGFFIYDKIRGQELNYLDFITESSVLDFDANNGLIYSLTPYGYDCFTDLMYMSNESCSIMLIKLFQNNYKYFSNGLKSLLKCCYKNSSSLISMLSKSTSSSFGDAIININESQINDYNFKWKKID